MKKKIMYLMLIFISHIIIISCSTSSTSKLPLMEEPFSPKTSNEKIKEYFSAPGRPYKTIGIVTAETPLFSYIPYAESYNTVKKLLKEEAKKLGADGIMDIKIDQEESAFATVFKGQAKALKLIVEEKGENSENGEKKELDDVDYSIRELLDTYEIVSSFKEVLEAIEKRPKNANNYILLGNIYSKKNEIDKAIEYYQRSIELNSDNPVAYRSIANSFKKKGQFEKAIIAYKNIID
ncbi:MAG: tetratricopeptide repeat protein, partial [Nitrospirota bacterium]